MASSQSVLLILTTVCMTVQAQNNQLTCNHTENVKSINLVKALESEAVDELTSTVASLVKSELARMAKVKEALAAGQVDLTSEMTIKEIVKELKAELTKDHNMAVSELREMMKTQEQITRDLAADMKALHEGLSDRLEKNFSRLEQRLDDMDCQHNESQEDLVQNGQTNITYRDCADVYHGGYKASGVYIIYPKGGTGVKVYCDMVTDGGGWTVFQKRFSGEVDFFRRWEQYAQGFGDPEGEYWLGLQHIHDLTEKQQTVLYVGVTDFDLGARYAKYGTFNVSSEAGEFRLTVGSYTGNAGDSLAYHNGQKFSTKDNENDSNREVDCGKQYHGAWWYNSCHFSNLNGRFSVKRIKDSSYMSWYHLSNSRLAMKTSVMMMRPANFKP